MTPDYPAHPLAQRLPEMSDEEYGALKLSIQNSGQQDAIVLLDGKILDGRHRYMICVELGIEPAFRAFGSLPTDSDNPILFVVAKATHRNLSAVQKAVAAETFLDDVIAGRILAKHDKRQSSHHAAELFGVNFVYVDQVRQVRKASPELYDELRRGRLKLTAAIARLKHKTKATTLRTLREQRVETCDDCRLLHGDNVELMGDLPDHSVRVIFADPPYNNGWKYRFDPHGDALPDTQYMQGMEAWMEEAHRVLSDDGSLFVVIDDRYSDDFGMSLKSIGFHQRRIIVWWETFGNYSSGETNLSPACRFIHYYSKTDAPFFNAVELRDPSRRLDKYNDPRANPLGKVPDSVWPVSRINGNDAERVPWDDQGQAPQLPVSIPERCILLASEPGDTVLDPFNGNGTTGIAALRNGRKYIGMDRDAVGLGRSERWINSRLADFKEQVGK